MKQNIIKRCLSLLVVLLLIFSFGAVEVNAAEINVTTLQDLTNALSGDNDIVLDNDITLNGDLYLNYANSLDLNGHTIDADTYGIVRCGSLISGLIGFAYAFPKINLKIDISYPLYLYHMTVVNVMLQLGYSGKRIHLLIAIMISCLFAFISTETIGKLANRIKLRL